MAASWECPSLPMVSLPSKETGKTSFAALKPLISAHFEENADSFNEEIKQLDQLREHAMHPPREYSGCTVIRRYFAQLHLIRVRFPPDTVGQLPIDFAWKDAFSGTEYIQEGLQIEQASVLYNLSALHSQLGSHGRRDVEQEMKEAVTHFQCAAGAYAYLDEHFAINHASKDLTPEFVTLYRNLMLGQAQECLVEKTLRGDGRVKNLTIAKLACRVSECYSQVVRALESEPCIVINRKNKDWLKLLKIKVVYFQALAHFFQGEHSLEASKYGEQIAYQELALQKVNSIGKVPKNLGEVARDAVRNFSAHVTEKVRTSRRQNEQVYHDSVPAPETLETLQGADILKPIAFHPTDMGVDIFQRLIPMRAHVVASVHSEEKAKLLRSVMSAINERDQDLEQFMTLLTTGEGEKVHEPEPVKIPEDVLQQHQLLAEKGEEVKKLRTDIQELMSLSEKVSEDLAYVAERKKEETREEEEFQAQFGPRPSSQVCAGVWKDMETYRGYHSQASKSNSDLKTMFDQHFPHLLLLSGPVSSIHAVVPKLTLMDAPAEDSTDTERWQELMGKIDQMRQQRSMLAKQLRDQINSDDITKALIGHLGSDQEAFIEERMKRHREIADIIWKNLSAQERILEAVTEANAKKAGTRHVLQEIKERRERLFTSLVKSGSYFGLLKSKIQEGLGFYSRIHGNVSKLRSRATDVCDARRRERENHGRRRTPTPQPSGAPLEDNKEEEVAPPTAAPARPPKRAELTGNIIPPDQRRLPPRAPHDHPDQLPPPPLPTHGPEQHQQQPGVVPMATSTPTLENLQRTQELQLRQLQGDVAEQGVSPQLPGVGVLPPPVLPDQGLPPQDTGLPQAGFVLPQASVPPTEPLPSAEPLPQVVSVGQEPMSELSMAGQTATSMAELLDLSLPVNSQRPGGPPEVTPLDRDPGQALLELLMPPGEGVSGPPLSDLGADQVVPGRPHGQETLPQLEPSDPASLTPPPPTSVVQTSSTEPRPPYQPPPGGGGPEWGRPVPLPEGRSPVPSSEVPPQTLGLDEDVHRPSPEGVQPSPVTGREEDGCTETKSFVETAPPAGTSQSAPESGVHLTEPVTSLPPEIPSAPPAIEQSINAQPGESTVTISSMSRPIAAVTSPTSHGDSETFNLTAQMPGGGTDMVIAEVTGTQAGLGVASTSELVQPQFVAGVQQLPHSPPPPPPPQTVTGGEQTHPVDSSASIAATISPLVTQGQPLTGLPTHLQRYDIPGPGATVVSGTEAPSVPAVPPIPSGEIPLLSSAMPSEERVPSLTEGVIGMPTVSLQGSQLPPLDVGSLNLSNQSTMLYSLPVPLSLQAPAAIQKSALSMELRPTHLETQLAAQQATIQEQDSQIAMHKQEITDRRKQMDEQKQQILLLQQQLLQLGLQQRKQDQEKAAASDQQAALMQLLQQQQGMFSHQQAQIEKLSQIDESLRKEQHEVEVKYKQALATEIGQKASLQQQVLQGAQEVQRLSQQLQAQVQQTQAVQLQLHQFHAQLQERDQQLLAFRDQHRQIVQALDQRHQQKVAYLIQQMQELQGEVKKAREQQKLHLQQLQGVPLQHRASPAVQMRPQHPLASQAPPNILRPPTSVQPHAPMSHPPSVQSFEPLPRNLPPPLQPTVSQPPGGLQGLQAPPNLPPPIQPQFVPRGGAEVRTSQALPMSGAHMPVSQAQSVPGPGALQHRPPTLVQPVNQGGQLPPGAVLYAAPRPHGTPSPGGEVTSPQPQVQSPGAGFPPGAQQPPTQPTGLQRQVRPSSTPTPPPMHVGGPYPMAPPTHQPQGPGTPATIPGPGQLPHPHGVGALGQQLYTHGAGPLGQQPHPHGTGALGQQPHPHPHGMGALGQQPQPRGAGTLGQQPHPHGAGSPLRMTSQVPESSQQQFQGPQTPTAGGLPHTLPFGHQGPITAATRPSQPARYPHSQAQPPIGPFPMGPRMQQVPRPPGVAPSMQPNFTMDPRHQPQQLPSSAGSMNAQQPFGPAAGQQNFRPPTSY